MGFWKAPSQRDLCPRLRKSFAKTKGCCPPAPWRSQPLCPNRAMLDPASAKSKDPFSILSWLILASPCNICSHARRKTTDCSRFLAFFFPTGPHQAADAQGISSIHMSHNLESAELTESIHKLTRSCRGMYLSQPICGRLEDTLPLQRTSSWVSCQWAAGVVVREARVRVPDFF